MNLDDGEKGGESPYFNGGSGGKGGRGGCDGKGGVPFSLSLTARRVLRALRSLLIYTSIRNPRTRTAPPDPTAIAMIAPLQQILSTGVRNE